MVSKVLISHGKTGNFNPKTSRITNGKLLTERPLLDRGMNLDECRAICTSPQIPLREKLFFRIIYETQLRPFEALNLLIENWDREPVSHGCQSEAKDCACKG